MEVESSDGFSAREDHFEGKEVVVFKPSEPGGKKGFLSRQRELMTLMSLLPPQADIRQLEAQAETACTYNKKVTLVEKRGHELSQTFLVSFLIITFPKKEAGVKNAGKKVLQK